MRHFENFGAELSNNFLLKKKVFKYLQKCSKMTQHKKKFLKKIKNSKLNKKNL